MLVLSILFSVVVRKSSGERSQRRSFSIWTNPRFNPSDRHADTVNCLLHFLLSRIQFKPFHSVRLFLTTMPVFSSTASSESAMAPSSRVQPHCIHCDSSSHPLNSSKDVIGDSCKLASVNRTCVAPPNTAGMVERARFLHPVPNLELYLGKSSSWECKECPATNRPFDETKALVSEASGTRVCLCDKNRQCF